LSDAPPDPRGVFVCEEESVLDLRLIREQPDMVKQAMIALNATAPIDEILELDQRRRSTLGEVERLKAERNEGSKAVSKEKDAAARNELIAAMRELGDRITVLDQQANAIDAELNDLLLRVPNLPLPEVPIGPDDTHNVVTREVGAKKKPSISSRNLTGRSVKRWGSSISSAASRSREPASISSVAMVLVCNAR